MELGKASLVILQRHDGPGQRYLPAIVLCCNRPGMVPCQPVAQIAESGRAEAAAKKCRSPRASDCEQSWRL